MPTASPTAPVSELGAATIFNVLVPLVMLAAAPCVIVIEPSASLAVVMPPEPINLTVSSLPIVLNVLSSAATLNV